MWQHCTMVSSMVCESSVLCLSSVTICMTEAALDSRMDSTPSTSCLEDSSSLRDASWSSRAWRSRQGNVSVISMTRAERNRVLGGAAARRQSLRAMRRESSSIVRLLDVLVVSS